MTQTLNELCAFDSKSILRIARVLDKNHMYPFDPDTKAAYEDPLEILLAAPVSKIEDYIPDGPGWCGDIYTIFWGHTEAFTLVGLSSNYDWAENFCDGKRIEKGQHNYAQ